MYFHYLTTFFYLLCGQFMFTGVLQEEPEHRLDERGDVHLQLLSHSQHYLLNQQDNGILDGTSRAPEFLTDGKKIGNPHSS